MLINKCGKFYNISKKETETIKHSIERSWFIVNKLHLDSVDSQDENTYQNTLRDSRLWYNLKILECKYDEDTEKKIKEIEDKIFV